jgi:hypothetical protein
MKWTDIPAGTLRAAEQRLWVAFGDDAETVAERINTDPAYLTNIVRTMIHGKFNITTNLQYAREIMGQNFFGIDDAQKHLAIVPTGAQVASLFSVPFSEGCLELYKDTHILIAVFPISIAEMRTRIGKRLFNMLDTNWCLRHVFAKYKCPLGWYLVRKTALEGSRFNALHTQCKLLGKDETVPTTNIMTYTLVGYALSKNEHLFQDILVRCSDSATVKIVHNEQTKDITSKVMIGFGKHGLQIEYCSDNDLCNWDIGLASMIFPHQL